MKNRNLFILMVAILMVFLGTGNVKALTGNCTVENGNKNGCAWAKRDANKDLLYITIQYKDGGKGETKQDTAYCVDHWWQWNGDNDEMKAAEYQGEDIVDFWYNYTLVDQTGDTTFESVIPVSQHTDRKGAEEFVKKMGVFKYYFEKEISGNASANTKKVYAQRAIWKLINEKYGQSYNSNDAYDKKVNDEWNKANQFYDQHKNEFEVSGKVWRNKWSSDEKGQPITVLNVKRKLPDYSLDAACIGCYSNIADSKAMVIQDTTNWSAITGSGSVSKDLCPNVSGYFYKKTGGTYCREEYHVYYPNLNNKIKIQLGRYFTINASKSELDAIDGTIPNLAPIKVTKIRQCKGGDLNKFKGASDDSFKKCGGNITLDYKENTYKYNGKLKAKLSSFSSSINGDMLEQKATFNYTLPDNTYRYIRIQDGYSMVTKPTDIGKTAYNDLGIANLPVSFNKDTKATVKFKYDLPTSSCDAYSTISKAYKEKNDYLSCGGTTVDNVYKKETNDEKLKDTACAKLYNSTTSQAFRDCVAVRKGNKMGNCFKFNKIDDSKNTGVVDERDYYQCNIPIDTVCNESTAGKKIDDNHDYRGYSWNKDLKKCVKPCTRSGDKYIGNDGKETTKENYEKICCNSTNHGDFGRDWDEKNGKCCEPGTVYSKNDGICCPSDAYDPTTGKCGGKPDVCNGSTIKDFPDKKWDGNTCCDKDDFNESTNTCQICNASNYITLGRDWNDNEGKCCPVGYKYNADSKKCEPERNTKCDDKHLNCEVCCEDAYGNVSCGYMINGNKVCPGKPETIEPVYRTIDIEQPFVSQTGSLRSEVGQNWCSYKIAGSGAVTCSSNPSENSVINAVISESNTDESKALYTVTLDANSIDKIRKYNDQHDYDDFEMNCNAKGEACQSKFLDSNYVEVQGKCSGNSDFYACVK